MNGYTKVYPNPEDNTVFAGAYKFAWSFEPYVEFVLYSTRVLGSKGRAVGWNIRPTTLPLP